MDFEPHLALASILGIQFWLVCVVIALLLAYLVIRFGVFHGLRAHTRWVDEGKDSRRDRHEPYQVRSDHRS